MYLGPNSYTQLQINILKKSNVSQKQAANYLAKVASICRIQGIASLILRL